MPILFESGIEDTGITIPYAANTEPPRTNTGFVDLRGRSELVPSSVHEATASPKLALLLEKLAARASPFFSVGCDLGSHVEEDFAPERQHVAGGYIQIVATEYDRICDSPWLKIFEQIELDLEEQVAGDDWIVHAFLHPIQIELDDYNDIAFSASIDFYALSPSPSEVQSSRERLISTLDQSITSNAMKAIVEDYLAGD